MRGADDGGAGESAVAGDVDLVVFSHGWER